MILTRAFLVPAAERTARAFAFSLASTLGMAGVLDLREVRWGQALSIAAGAALLSALTSIVAGTGVVGPKGSPSLVADPNAAPAAPAAAAESHGHVRRVVSRADLLPPPGGHRRPPSGGSIT